MDTRKVGEKLKRMRGNKSQEELAEALEIPTRTYASYEQGARTPKDSMKIKIARYYDESVESIFFN